MQNNDIKYLVALSCFAKFGPVRLNKLRANFKDWHTAFSSKKEELIKAGIEENVAAEFCVLRLSYDPDVIMDRLQKEKIQIITIDDEAYPRLLKEIYNPPVLLYYRGEIKKEQDEYAIAIIGSRKFTTYGRQAAAEITTQLSRSRITIVSGLALGIDSVVHEETVRSEGRTIAVLGSGLDRQSIYPSINRYLADKIVEKEGAVISEFPLGTAPLKHNFPQRNRIIAGLSIGTLVIEAAEKSGALITAQFALEQNREVFALPGSIFSALSVGPNKLIKQGARPITSAIDIIETLNLRQVPSNLESKKIVPQNPNEEIILPILTREPVHINDIIRRTGLDTSLINSTLLIMEMKGMVKNIGGMQYILAR